MRRAETGGWLVELLGCGPYEATYIPDAEIIGFAFDSQVGVHAFGTSRKTAFAAKPNGLAYVPRGCDVNSQSPYGGEYLKFTMVPAHETTVRCERRFSDVVDLPAICAAQQLRSMLLSNTSIDPIELERWLLVLAGRAAHFLDGKSWQTRAGSWMTARRLKRIDELIEARLDGPMTVRELAAALGLSDGFFSRAFKAAIGQAPYQYIIDRRIARARSLLENNGKDLSTIAQASGFTSHAHMTATFRNRLGVTPSQLRGN